LAQTPGNGQSSTGREPIAAVSREIPGNLMLQMGITILWKAAEPCGRSLSDAG
jgi:hypothetical protein